VAHEKRVRSKAFRDADMGVVYWGMFQTPERVVKTAIAEDADAISLSFHMLEHNEA